MSEYTAKDFKKGQPRWCPGCGDHFSWLRYTRLWQKSVSLHGIRQ